MMEDFRAPFLTSWEIWLHPRRALTAMEEAERVVEEASLELKEAQQTIERQRVEIERLREETGKLRAACEDRDVELESMRSRLGRALDELSDYNDVDAQLKEFEIMLSGFEKVKMRYERRIRDLEARLADARIKTERAADMDLLEDIFPEETPEATSSSPKSPPKDIDMNPEPEEDDWLF